MRTFLKLIWEYILILRNQIRGRLSKSLPKNWQNGTKGNVLLIQGLNGFAINFEKVGTELNRSGYKIHGMLGLNTRDKVIPIAKRYVDFIEDNDLDNLIIICHSKGGIVSKYILDNYPEINKRVKLVISIAVPFGGTGLGWLPFWNIPELAINGELINTQLAITKNNHKFFNLYSELDNHVLYSNSLVLEGAENKLINIVGHTRILEADKTINLIKEKLDSIYV